MTGPAPDTGRTAPADFRCGLVAVIGRPNVGKSTLINAIVGEKVSITSSKPQTTRERVMGVASFPDAQLVFVDTPGFQTAHRSRLLSRMSRATRGAVADVDAVALVIDAHGWRPGDEDTMRLLGPRQRAILVINKVDRLRRRDELLPLLAESAQKRDFHAIVPVSAEKRRGLEDLVGEIKPLLPVSPPLFDPDIYTDRPPRFLAAEIIREKAFRLLGDELPYGVAVRVDDWSEDERRLILTARLIVARESHKPMVIGAGGARLSQIGRAARLDLRRLLGKPVELRLLVQVRRGWSDDERSLREFGYDD